MSNCAFRLVRPDLFAGKRHRKASSGIEETGEAAAASKARNAPAGSSCSRIRGPAPAATASSCSTPAFRCRASGRRSDARMGLPRFSVAARGGVRQLGGGWSDQHGGLERHRRDGSFTPAIFQANFGRRCAAGDSASGSECQDSCAKEGVRWAFSG